MLKVFVYKLVGEDWTLVEGVNLNTAYDEDAANPDGVASENTAEEANQYIHDGDDPGGRHGSAM